MPRSRASFVTAQGQMAECLGAQPVLSLHSDRMPRSQAILSLHSDRVCQGAEPPMSLDSDRIWLMTQTANIEVNDMKSTFQVAPQT
ncbi:hypothetical protein HaLaN_27183, partial [Haematococcus lacustris]